MAEFEDKLNAVLSNPELMGQILSMAGSLNQQPSTPPPPPPPSANFGSMPFVPEDRLVRLEKAMQASLIAKFASAAMNQGGRNV